ncbi:MAG: GIY-YIG nuclease family protein, partial [Actinomycetaceae bacterium]|nr:GIY-YIG nuclease family protein [Actinomycetaceae bacterium]
MATTPTPVNTSQRIATTRPIRPMCYGWSTPDIPKYDGWVKIGYTDKQTVEDRVAQQASQLSIAKKIEWSANAIYEDGSGETFKDHDFHDYLEYVKHVERERKPEKTEWFHIKGPESKAHFYEFRERGEHTTPEDKQASYTLRAEQERAVNMTRSHFNMYGPGSKF